MNLPSEEKQKPDKTKPAVPDEPALVEGRLMEVNWACASSAKAEMLGDRNNEL